MGLLDGIYNSAVQDETSVKNIDLIIGQETPPWTADNIFSLAIEANDVKPPEYFTYKDKFLKLADHGEKVRLEDDELSRHEIVYNEEGYPMPNPMGAAGITPLLPTGPIDLALETILTGISSAKGVDPSLGILAGILAGKGVKAAPGAAKFANVKGGSYLSRKAYNKAFESVKTDPMLRTIPFKDVSKFRKPSWHPLGQYNLDKGKHLQSGNISKAKGVFEFRDKTLSELFALPYNPRFSPWYLKPKRYKGVKYHVPDILNRKWAESTVRHEGRHHKQHLEHIMDWDMKNKTTVFKSEVPKYAMQPRDDMKTLINIPTPKNWKKIFPDFTFDSKGKYVGWNKPELRNKLTKEIGRSKALKNQDWFERSFLPNFKYYSSPHEVEARLESIAMYGNKRSRSYKQLRFEAGFTRKQIDDMLKKYKIAKRKLYASNFGYAVQAGYK